MRAQTVEIFIGDYLLGRFLREKSSKDRVSDQHAKTAPDAPTVEKVVLKLIAVK